VGWTIMTRRKGKSQMAGIFDFLDPSKEGSIFEAFGSKPSKKPEKPLSQLPALPAPKSQLPIPRPEERGLSIPKESVKEKLLSIFDVFGPTEMTVAKPAPLLPEEVRESQREVAKREEPWEVMFEPSPEQPLSPIPVRPEEVSPRYRFIGPSITRIPYGEREWGFPSAIEMAHHLEEIIDLDTVFDELYGSRLTSGYQDLLAEAAFHGVPLYTPISVIDDKNFFTDFAGFYGIPWSVVETMPSKEEFISRLLNPLSLVLTEAFEAMKPEFLPGFFTVAYNAHDGKYWLYYVEPWLGRLPGP
jgi:hypothetical protein